jgi:hypothetical protein
MQTSNTSPAKKVVVGLVLGAGILFGISSTACSVTVSSTCPAGFTDCGGVCVDLQHDDYDCGACGFACNAGDYCSGGACVPGSCTSDLAPCATDFDCCSGVCAGGDGLCGCVNNNETGCAVDTDCCDPGAICSGGVCQ